jgi:hypothetical protein
MLVPDNRPFPFKYFIQYNSKTTINKEKRKKNRLKMFDNRLLTVEYAAVWYGTVQYSTLQYGMVQYITVQYTAVWYGTVQYAAT